MWKVTCCLAAAIGVTGASLPARDSITSFVVGQVVDQSGAAVPGAVVTATQRSAAASRWRSLTIDGGRFLIQGLPAGQYMLTAAAPGYFEGAYGRQRPDDTGRSLTFDGVAGRGRVTIVVWQHASVSGTVTDDAGSPLPDVAVTALRHDPTWRSLPRTARTVFTDDRGRYRIDGLQPAEYIIYAGNRSDSQPAAFAATVQAMERDRPADLRQLELAIRRTGGGAGIASGVAVGEWVLATGASQSPIAGITPAGRFLVYAPASFGVGTPPGPPLAVAVNVGETRLGIDFALRRVTAVSIRGTIEFAGTPAGHFRLELRAPFSGMDAGGLEFGQVVASTMSDGEGRFAFLGVPPGVYVIGARESPAPSERSRGSSDLHRANRVRWAAVSTDATVDVMGVVVPLQSGLTVSGRVRRQNELPGREGSLGSVSLQAVDFARTVVVPRVETEVGRDGTFAVGSLLPGLYRLSWTGPADWTVASITQAGRVVDRDVIPVGGAGVTAVTIDLTDAAGSITGTIRRRTGGPDLSVRVVLFPADRALWATVDPRRTRDVAVDDYGTFRFRSVPPGHYYVVAVDDRSLDRGWQRPETLDQLAVSAVRTSLRNRENVSLDVLVRAGS
jgi:protocatechuate 3,4-dioxygenase beta subunit